MAPCDWQARSELVGVGGKLVCPKCRKPFKGHHILQCNGGHIFCEKCDRGKRCPTCKVRKGLSIRNRQLEHIASNTTILDLIGSTSDQSQTPATPLGPNITCQGCDKRKLKIWCRALTGSADTFCDDCSRRKFATQACLRLTPATDDQAVALIIEKYAETKAQGTKRATIPPQRNYKRRRQCY